MYTQDTQNNSQNNKDRGKNNDSDNENENNSVNSFDNDDSDVEVERINENELRELFDKCCGQGVGKYDQADVT